MTVYVGLVNIWKLFNFFFFLLRIVFRVILRTVFFFFSLFLLGVGYAYRSVSFEAALDDLSVFVAVVVGSDVAE